MGTPGSIMHVVFPLSIISRKYHNIPISRMRCSQGNWAGDVGFTCPVNIECQCSTVAAGFAIP